MSLSSKAGSNLTLLLGTVVGLVWLAVPVWAETPAEAVQLQEASAHAKLSVTGDLSQKTDIELTELTARWSSLSPGERRKLLAEVTGRMEANRKLHPNMGVRVQRRYGRIVRKSDGSVVVETRVVQVRPSADAGVSQSRVSFGIGFEQRSRVRQSAPPKTSGESDIPSSSLPAVTIGRQQAPAQEQ